MEGLGGKDFQTKLSAAERQWKREKKLADKNDDDVKAEITISRAICYKRQFFFFTPPIVDR